MGAVLASRPSAFRCPGIYSLNPGIVSKSPRNSSLEAIEIQPDFSENRYSTGEINRMSEKQKKWPETLDEAVETLLSTLSEEELLDIKNTSEYGLFDFHFTLGAYIRNEFGLWGENRELIRSIFKRDVLVLPDQASMVIIEELWKRLQQE